MAIRDRITGIGRLAANTLLDRVESGVEALRPGPDPRVDADNIIDKAFEESRSMSHIGTLDDPGDEHFGGPLAKGDPGASAGSRPAPASERKRGPSAAPPMPPTDLALEDPKALYWDPFALVEQLGYKERPSAVTYGTLQAMVWKVPLVNAIIQTRINQISAFATPQRNRFETGFRVRLRDQEAKPTRQDKIFMKKMEDMLITTGNTEDPRGRDSFETFLRKITRDSLTYDQTCIEVVPGRDGRPAEWYAVDAATVRLADTHRLHPDDNTDRIKTVQIYDQVVISEFTDKELAFGVRNPRSDIRSQGYGTCLHPDSFVQTTRGLRRIEDLVDESELSVAIGGRSLPARAYATRELPVMQLRLVNGYQLKSSAEHRIRVMQDDGTYGWCEAGKLRIGDWVVCEERLTTEGRDDLRFGYYQVESVEETAEVVQMYDIEVFDDEHAFVADGIVVHNSELEMLISTITHILWGLNYNANFFCISGDLRITTDKGILPVADLVGQEFKVWTGDKYAPAHAVRTGRRPLVRTKLFNGLELKTSPDHRFFVIPTNSSDGTIEECRQADLRVGDVALVDAAPVECDEDLAALFVGQEFSSQHNGDPTFTPTPALLRDESFWEMIGFALCDGHWPTRVGPLQIFPSDTKEVAERLQFLETCRRHTISIQETHHMPSHKRPSGEYGYTYLAVHYAAFIAWLRMLGFRASSEGKRVPNIFFAQPIAIRTALLRGMFSADGHRARHITGYCTPTINKEDKAFRQDILQLLWSVGVAANDTGSGFERDGRILVQDVAAFVARVGYLQDYKNEGLRRAECSQYRWDVLHPAVSCIVAAQLKASSRWLELSAKDRAFVGQATKSSVRLSRPRALKLLQQVGEEPPRSLLYHHCKIDVVDRHSIGEEQMYDIEVFDNDHLFFAGGVAVHNSQGSVAKGLLNLKGAIPEKQLRAFRRQWYQMVAGVENAWRTPIVNAEEIQWVNMQASNRDMEFSSWIDFLIKIACAVFQMDPIEVNFKYGSTGQRAMFGAADRAKLVESKDKGLKPLLRHFSRLVDKYIIWPINPAFVLEFIGLESQTPKEVADLNTQRVRTIYTIDEIRAENDLSALPDGLGQVILDANWLAARKQAMDAKAAEEAAQQAQAMTAMAGPGLEQQAAPAGVPPGGPVVGERGGAPGAGGKRPAGKQPTAQQQKELEALLRPTAEEKSEQEPMTLRKASPLVIDLTI